MPLKLALLLFVGIKLLTARVYDRCELAKELKYVHNLPQQQISTWVCIAQHESLLDTSATNQASGDHGLFQISQLFWCSPPGNGYGCNTPCASFRDDNIADDVKCIKKIFKEHTRLSGDGFNAWTVYPLYCKGDTTKYIAGCLENIIDNTINAEVEEENSVVDEDDDGYDFPPLPNSPKVYNRCELANELKIIHNFPDEEISKWVCIAEHESNLNTSATNPGSGDHGLFQISEQYWCSSHGKGFGCNANCASFRDNNITDDVKCVRTIYNEHTAISGDGFNAWVVYPLYCKGDTSSYTRGCVQSKVTEKPIKEDNDGYEFPSLPSPPKKVVENIIDSDVIYEFPPLPKIPPYIQNAYFPTTKFPFVKEKHLEKPFKFDSGIFSSYSFLPSETTSKPHESVSVTPYKIKTSAKFESTTISSKPTSSILFTFKPVSKLMNKLNSPKIEPFTVTSTYSPIISLSTNYSSNLAIINSHSNKFSPFKTTSKLPKSVSVSPYKTIANTKFESITVTAKPVTPTSAFFTFKPVSKLANKLISTKLESSTVKSTYATPIIFLSTTYRSESTSDSAKLKAKLNSSNFQSHWPISSFSKQRALKTFPLISTSTLAETPRHLRPTTSRRPLNGGHQQARPFTGLQKPSRPFTGRPPPPPPPPRPPRPSGLSTQTPNTMRPFYNLPGPIFTLRPSSTVSPVSTSVYSTSPKSFHVKESFGNFQSSASVFSNVFAKSSSTLKPTLAPPNSSGINVKREGKKYNNEFPGGPVILSFPHLLHADEEYLNSVDGLKPSSSKHETFVTLEPLSGFPLQLARRVQFNIFLRPIDGFNGMENVSNALIPLFWIEESTILKDKYIDKLKNTLFRTINIVDIVKWVIIGSGASCVIIALVFAAYMQTP